MLIRNYNIFAVSPIVLLSFFLSGCSNKNTDKKNATEDSTYDVLQVKSQDVGIYTDYPATIQGEEVIEIRPRVEGYLEELYVDEGAHIVKGQRLFRISSPQYDQDLRIAEAAIHTAQSEIDAAQLTVRKTKPLVEREIISEYELESAEYTLKSKQAALAQAQASLANARANVGFTLITSPADGIIGTIPYKKGSLVSSSSTSALTTLAVTKDVFAYFAMNEKQLLEFNRTYTGGTIQQKLKNLPPVQLVLADGSVYTEQGRLETASGIINTQTGSVNFRATFHNPEALLQSGASASVRIPRRIQGALLIPQSATYELQDKRMVYVLDNKDTAHGKAISTIPTTDGQSFIVTAGLAVGDRIVTNGLTSIKEGDLVKPSGAQEKTLQEKQNNN